MFAEGAWAVADFYRTSIKLHGGSPRTRHLVTLIDCDPPASDGSVVARSVYVVLQDVGGETRAIVAGRYVDRFGRHAGKWHFLERRFFVDVAGDLSEHLTFELRTRKSQEIHRLCL